MRTNKRFSKFLAWALAFAAIIALAPLTAFTAENVDYVDAAGVPQTPQNGVTEVEDTDTEWETGWYVAGGEITIPVRVTVTGAVNLILADGAHLTVEGGIGVTGTSNSLTIWAQSHAVDGDWVHGNYSSVGKLTATTLNTTTHSAIGSNVGATDRSAPVAGSITINGGVISATASDVAGSTNTSAGAGIGGGGAGSSVTINNGHVTAKGSKGGTAGSASSGAGIGCAGFNGYAGDTSNIGIIEINGGYVDAQGGAPSQAGPGGAGIGGAGIITNFNNAEFMSGSITITDGIVFAVGGNAAANYGNNNDGGAGAGIGGGGGRAQRPQSAPDITISGGTVTAQGGHSLISRGGAGAGIGGGGSNNNSDTVYPGGAGGTIIISGNANVTATGGRTTGTDGSQNTGAGAGAGIGGGGGTGRADADGGAGGTITISGGATVTATGGTAPASGGGSKAMDIGGGGNSRATDSYGDGGTLSITGSTVSLGENGTNSDITTLTTATIKGDGAGELEGYYNADGNHDVTVTLTASPTTPGFVNNAVTLTAEVYTTRTSGFATLAPGSDTITFSVGATPIGSPVALTAKQDAGGDPVLENGYPVYVATTTWTPTAVADNLTLTAAFTGDTRYESATGTVSSYAVNLPALTGTVTIDDDGAANLVPGTVLTAVTTTLTSDPTGADLSVITYQWRHVGDAAVIGTDSTYTLAATDAGKTITVTVTTANTDGSKTSDATGTVVLPGAGMDAPTLVTRTANSITVTAEKVGGTNAQDIEYARSNGVTSALDGTTWQDTGVFTGLAEYTEYYFFARTKALPASYYLQGAPSSSSAAIRTQMDITGKTVTADFPTNLVYTGSAHEPTPTGSVTVTFGSDDITLTAGTDYTLGYTSNVNAGEATATFTGTGNFTGTVPMTFNIAPAPLTITGFSISKTYDGDNTVTGFGSLTFEGFVPSETAEVSTAGVTATYDSANQGADQDITFGGADFSMATGGTATASNYSITQPTGITGTINKLALADSMLSITAPGPFTYTGSAQTPAYTLNPGTGMTATLDTDYTVEWSANTIAGEATLTVTATTAGNYSGKAETTFTIAPKNISTADVFNAVFPPVSYTGDARQPTPTSVTADDLTVTYTLTNWKDNTAAGTASVDITGTGNFTGTRSATFTIDKVILTPSIDFTNVTDKTYDGTAAITSTQQPTITLAA
ncbi:MAG: YDG domain-containing protein, partial [Oscillospiraceae bacterium]|nr:YDG domain-containing protein [Oscillospiraceae bacterium]